MNECSVCKDEFSIGDKYIQMPCKHPFHSTCILPWLENVKISTFSQHFLVFYQKTSTTVVQPADTNLKQTTVITNKESRFLEMSSSPVQTKLGCPRITYQALKREKWPLICQGLSTTTMKESQAWDGYSTKENIPSLATPTNRSVHFLRMLVCQTTLFLQQTNPLAWGTTLGPAPKIRLI